MEFSDFDKSKKYKINIKDGEIKIEIPDDENKKKNLF